ncbi:DUF2868 domain-containing protein [Haloferula chungangensis]|uniref:DUF2868 domain-containing protein n=1 Tax=Haloferula chungangensis TaxID=1048331 RepID=A0ABW2L963_9BACT
MGKDADSWGVPGKSDRWTLTELIDFETALGSWSGKDAPRLSAGEGRAAGMKQWLGEVGASGLGARWMASLGLAGSLLALVFGGMGAATAWGTLDREIGGVHVIWFLTVCLFLPWIMFLGGALVWLLRGRVAASGVTSRVIAWLSVKLAGKKARQTIERIRANGELSRVLAWRLVRQAQWIAGAFHGGALVGLGTMVMFKRVGFFWETTTEQAMEKLLAQVVGVLELPWAWQIHWAQPDIAASEISADWKVGGLAWWPFLILALFTWGILPRFLMVGWAAWNERRALATLTFQAPQHRKLWRSMTVVKRGEKLSGPVDGALVVALDGAEPSEEKLRPYLLRVLRMNPTGWERLGVLDEDHEEAAREALKKASAGIVLLAEGWSLAPRSVGKALDEITTKAGERRVVLLVGNPTPEGGMKPVEPEQRIQWETFMDARKGSEVELVFYEEVRA